MLIDSQSFEGGGAAPGWSDESVFRFCEFDGLSIDSSFDGALLWSTLRNSEFYWVLFNTAIIARTRFENCVFRGASFRGCQVVDCDFSGCRFDLDNLGGGCVIDGCSFTECRFDRCIATPDPRGRPLATNTRVWGCEQTNSRGLETLFAGPLTDSTTGKRRKPQR